MVMVKVNLTLLLRLRELTLLQLLLRFFLILSGAKYTVPAGYVFDGDGSLNNPTVSFFDQSVFSPIDPSDSSFYISLARGQLSVAKSPSTDAKGNVIDPQVVVYRADGTLL